MAKELTAIAAPEEHPFAPFVRILGKGKTGSRSLTCEEAHRAMSMILNREVEDIQLGAFLMLLRVKEESADELTGFARAVQDHLSAPPIAVDLDWSSYAGKRRQLPWYLLSALALSDQGIRTVMHGAKGHTAGRLYSEEVLQQLGIQPARNWEGIEQALDHQQFAFISLEDLCPPLQEMIDYRNHFGLRSPVHTLTRLINPLRAPYSVQSIFHPAYAINHQQAAINLNQPHAAVFKGEGGEVERRPEATCQALYVHNGVASEAQWPKMVEGRQEYADMNDIALLKAVWRGQQRNGYGEQAVIGTLAILQLLLQRCESPEAATELAHQCWEQRNRDRI